MKKDIQNQKETSILFVIPPYFNADDFVDKQKSAVLPAFTIPYGILSLEAYLSKNCSGAVNIKILDLNIDLKYLLDSHSQENLANYFENKIIEVCKEFVPDIVGISALFNSSFKYLEQNASTIKKYSKDVLVLAGGGLPSAAYKEVLSQSPSIDAVCKGEGELPLRALIDANDRVAVLESHKSWVTSAAADSGKIPALDFVEDLDDIPELNYELLDLTNYNSRSIDKRFAEKKSREMSIHTSRGCPFMCVFCSNPSLHGKSVRTMSIPRIVSDVRRMRDDYGMDVLLIEDDHFFNDVPRAKDVLKSLIELGIRIEFPNGVAVYAIDDEVASLFARAGVSSVALAVESGSDYVLKNIIKKPLKKKLIKPAVDNLRRHGVMSHVFIVIGLPGEMPEHRDETLEMLINSGFDWAHVFCAIPIYGSRLFDICVENDYIEDSTADDYVTTKSLIRAPGVDPDNIQIESYDMNLAVNFVNNFNFKIKNYKIAEDYFRNVCEKYPEHMFGQLFLAETLKAQGKEDWLEHLSIAKEIYNSDNFWIDKVAKFEIGHLLS
ncbi:MAG: B12-binding domain-containing radical SAM protein [Rhodospirillaceae bacterium]|nr:B12-binding domain-containing radical SAM protein [Rhodospirillaceae bacterium]